MTMTAVLALTAVRAIVRSGSLHTVGTRKEKDVKSSVVVPLNQICVYLAYAHTTKA